MEQSLPDFLTFNFRDRLHVKNALPPWGYVVAWRVRQRETSGSHEAESIAACEVEAILNGAAGPADCCYLVLVLGQPIVKVGKVQRVSRRCPRCYIRGTTQIWKHGSRRLSHQTVSYMK